MHHRAQARLEYLKWRITQIKLMDEISRSKTLPTPIGMARDDLKTIRMTFPVPKNLANDAACDKEFERLVGVIRGSAERMQQIAVEVKTADLSQFADTLMECGLADLRLTVLNCDDRTCCQQNAEWKKTLNDSSSREGQGVLLTFAIKERYQAIEALATGGSVIRFCSLKLDLDSCSGPPGQAKQTRTVHQTEAPQWLQIIADKVAASYQDQFSKVIDSLNINPFEAGEIAIVGPVPPRGRRSRLAVPPSAFRNVFGDEHIIHIMNGVYDPVQLMPRSNGVIQVTDIRRVLAAETNAAYQFLERPENSEYWDFFCVSELAQAIETRDRFQGLSDNQGGGSFPSVSDFRYQFQAKLPQEMRHSISGRWPGRSSSSRHCWIGAIQDMQRVAEQKGCACLAGQPYAFCRPVPALEACEAFKEYVRCRWPIHVFALDPVTQDQNVADIFNRRRELQLAMAAGVASGNVSASAAARFSRRLEKDIETIALNRTAVAFSHSNDTFGWRFYPRVQSPPTPGTVGALWETLAGGPSEHKDLKNRKLEPGIRECVAIVVMPSFVPYVTLESRANWFGLSNPRKKQWTLHDTMELSRGYQSIQNTVQCVCTSNTYRAEDIAGLHRTVQDLEKRLPFQSETVQIPYENTLGGFELFNVGVTDLGPELLGWYGAPGINVAAEVSAEDKSKTAPTQPTTLFLVGDGFSVHETKVIAGGRLVADEDMMLLSRQIMRVTVSPTVNAMKYGNGASERDYVDIHVATPYGVTNHLLVPAVTAKAKSDLEAKVKTVEETVKAIQQTVKALNDHVVEFKLEASDFEKLQLSACKLKPPSVELKCCADVPPDASLSFKYVVANPVLLNDRVDVQAKYSVFYQGAFVNPLEQIDANGSPWLRLTGTTGSFSINLKELADHVAEVVQGRARQSDIQSDKITAQVVFYFEVRKDQKRLCPPIRASNPLTVEAAVAKEYCDCCPDSGTASAVPSSAPTPSIGVPTEAVSGNN